MSERFDDVVVRTHVEGADLVVLTTPGGEHDDRKGRTATPQVGEQIEAVPGPEVEVDQRHDGVLLFEQLDRASRFRRDQRHVSRLLNDESKQINEDLFVVDQEDLVHPPPEPPPSTRHPTN